MSAFVGLLVACVACAALAGCEEEEPLLLRSMGIRQIPVDSTLPGELPEGTYVAFGLKMPRDLRMEVKQPKSIRVSGPMGVEEAANYFRQRVEGGKVETGPTRTIFKGVTVLDAPDRQVDISVFRIFQGVRIIVIDKTRKKAKPEPDLSEKERWGRMGLTQDGKVLEKYAQ